MNELHACDHELEQPKGISRRALFAGIAGGLAAIGLISVSDSAMAAAKTYTVGTKTSIPLGSAKFFNLGGHRVMVAHTSNGFHAYSGNCTHRVVGLVDPGTRSATVTCPRHGATFSKTSGSVVGIGPAPSGLHKYTVSVSGANVKVTLP